MVVKPKNWIQQEVKRWTLKKILEKIIYLKSVSVFCLPKDPKQERWIKVVPTYNVTVQKDTVIG